MFRIGSRVLITRSPDGNEDPEQIWLNEFEEIIGLHGTILKDVFPYALDTLYALVDVDQYTDFYLPAPVLTLLK